MKKILFTIQWYPTVLSANALCDEKIINLLKRDKQYEINCLTYKNENQAKVGKYNDIKVFRFRRSLWWDIVIKAKQNKGLSPSFILKLDHLLLRIKQVLTIPIFPIVNLKSCIKFALKAYNLQKKNNYDIVISEHHGIDSLLAGYFLKRHFPQIKFVAILWDPISAKTPVRYLSARYALNRSIALERSMLKHADYVIGMKSSENTVSVYNLGYDEKHKFFDIPGIVEQVATTYKCPQLKDGYVNIVYSGVLSLPDRDPSYLIDIINLCPFAERVNLVFFCTGFGRVILEQKSDVFKGIISICDYIPHADLLSVYRDSDVLLNFGGVNESMVPSKIFEYMSMCKPILSTYKIDNEASKHYLDRYPSALCLDERKSLDENALLLQEFLQNIDRLQVSFEEVKNKFPLNTPAIYVDLIKQL